MDPRFALVRSEALGYLGETRAARRWCFVALLIASVAIAMIR
jgi:hypothetical protein